MPSKDYLQSVTIGGAAAHNGGIELCDYDPDWPELYQGEAGKIRAALGGTARQIEHVGSTSVPLLCAKPIIDILLTVRDSADENGYREQLEKAGYILRVREPEWFEHRMFKGKDPEVNLHVLTQGCREAERMLKFRDRLRTSEKDRLLYAAAKVRLAGRTWEYVQDYADAKTEVVEGILKRADRKTEAD